MARRHPDDLALHAVARVRSVREQDSRSGLQQANRELAEATEELDALTTGLETPLPTVARADAYVAARAALTALGGRIRAARKDVEMRRNVATAALAQWQADRARVRVVELLLERRAAERRTAAERAAARELDDIAAQRVRSRRTAAEDGERS